MVDRPSPFFVIGRQVYKYSIDVICLLVSLSTSLHPHYNIFMPSVRFPNVMKYYVNNQAEISVPAATVKDMIQNIVEQYPSVKFQLVDSEGNLRKHFNIFINGTHIRDLDGMDTPLEEEDKVILMASAAGG